MYGKMRMLVIVIVAIVFVSQFVGCLLAGESEEEYLERVAAERNDGGSVQAGGGAGASASVGVDGGCDATADGGTDGGDEGC